MSEAPGNLLESNTSKDLLELKRNISELDKTEQLEILKIIQRHQDRVTENKNGIFINLCNISKTAISEVTAFVKYSIENRIRLSNLERLSEALLKESMLKRQYDGYECSDVNSGETEPEELSNIKPLSTQRNISKLTDNISLDDSDSDSECITCITSIPSETPVDQMDDEITDDIVNVPCPLPVRKTKYTGRSARILKRCKEINRSHQSEHMYYIRTPCATGGEEDDDDDDDDDDIHRAGKSTSTLGQSELVEEEPPF
jgi:hypothetical protein